LGRERKLRQLETRCWIWLVGPRHAAILGAAESTPHFFSTQLLVSAVMRKLTRRIGFLLDFSFVVSSYTFMSNYSL
jgi:hypothetical protein